MLTNQIFHCSSFFQELDGVDFGTAWENHPDHDIRNEINGINLSNIMQDEACINVGFVPDRAGYVLSKRL